MPTVRSAIEAFVSGSLDYGGLQAEFRESAEAGTPRDVALHELRAVGAEVGVSTALNNLIARAIDAEFGSPRGPDSHTVPGGRADETAPGKAPRKAPRRRRPKKKASPPPESGGTPPTEALRAEAPEPPAPELPAEAGADDPVDDLPPIYAGGEDDATASPALEVLPAGAVLPEPGTVLANRYVLQSVLGRGGMGVVYRALDRRREESGAASPFVALKVIRRDLQGRPAARERLFTEARQGQSLRHPNVVAVYDFDREGELAFVTMELLEGERLRTIIVRSAPTGLPTHEAFAVLRGILDAVAHLHVRGVVHRDLTPGNVLITNDGVPKLLDFGLTRGPDRGGEPTLGAADVDDAGHTPAYASPELLDGQPADPRDDVYALGVIAYELLTSKHPFDKLAADEAHRRHLKPSAPRGLSHAQWRTLRSALSFKAARRPPDARALLQGMALTPVPRRTLRPGVAQGLLAGVAAGVLLTLAVIHPEGPIGSRLEDPVAPVAALPPSEGAAAGQQGTGAVPTAESASGPMARADSPLSEAGTPAPAADDEVLTPLGAGAVVTEPAAANSGPAADAASDRPAPPPDPRPGRLELAEATYRVSEGTAVLIAEVVRRDGARGVVGVRWRTVSLAAQDGDDYIGNEWQRLELGDGELDARIFVPLVDDGIAEMPESFVIELDAPDGGASLGDRIRSEVRILDDDSA